MKIFQELMKVKTKAPHEFVEITDEIERVVKRSGIKNGMVFVNTPHTTAALLLQEGNSSVHKDLTEFLEKLFPLDEKYHHVEEGSLNAVAHLKSSMLKTFLTIPLKESELMLGVWQRVFLVELFEKREREVIITVVGE